MKHIPYCSYLILHAYTGTLQTVFYSTPPSKPSRSAWYVCQDLPSVGGVTSLVFTLTTPGP